MESRAILAFVLSMLVFVGWNFFLESQREDTAIHRPMDEDSGKIDRSAPTKVPGTGAVTLPTLPKAVTGAPEGPPEVISAADFTSKSPPALSQAQGKTAREIVVSMGKSELTLTTEGAGIKSFKLFKYKGQNGGPVELIQTMDGNIPSPQAILDDNNITIFAGRSIYDTSTESLVLSESNPVGKVTFTLKDPSGLEIIKEFSFRYDSYRIGCSIDMRYGHTPLKAIKFSWNDGISSGRDGKDFYTYEGPTTLIGIERMEDLENVEEGPVRHGGDLKWTAYQSKYFAVALIPELKEAIAVINKGRSETPSVALEYGLDSFPFQKKFSIFLGPKETEHLNRDEALSLDRLIDYGWFGNKFGFLVKPLFEFLQFFYRHTGNYGWSIIILTMIIKILFFPLSHKSFKSMKKMQKLQPEIKILQERYKNDRQMLSQEMMRIYREKKVNPLGGCLPMLLQIPVFIALYHVLLISIELRNAPFGLWLTDLSEKDPYYVTPLLMGASMFLQQKMTPSVGDPTQQKLMMIMPIVFTFLFLNFPCGLVIYWLVNNVLTIAQQYYINKFSD